MRHVQSQCATRVPPGAHAPSRSARGTDTATGCPGAPLPAGYAPDALGATSGGVFAVAGNSERVDTRTGAAARPLNVGAYTYPTVITITGTTAVVIEPYGYTVELINLKTRHVFPPITVGAFPTAVAITA